MVTPAPVLELRLRTLEDCAALGGALAACLREPHGPRCILLRGDLGSGKTTLTRFLVEALPGGDRAEVSSPSFTICNYYPTEPELLHCDLYRTGADIPEELIEALGGDGAGKSACVAEWAEHIPPALLPEDFLDIHLQLCDEYRIVQICVRGPAAARPAELLRAALTGTRGI